MNIIGFSGVEKGVNGWLTTFGDMLTLLLCFFLSLVGSGQAMRSGTSEKTLLDSNVSTTNNSGIPIANYNQEIEPLYKVSIFESDLILGGQGVEEKLKLLKSHRKSVRSDSVGVVISTCLASVQSGSSDSWRVSQERAQRLESQILDARIEAPALAIRGPWCKGFLDQEGDNKEIAVISIENYG